MQKMQDEEGRRNAKGKRAHPNGAGWTEKALPSAGQGFFERLESEEGVRTLPPDLRFRNALSVRTDA